MRLICLPYAGGSASIYRSLPKLLPSIEIYAVELPGRGRRLSEPAHESMESLVQALLLELRSLLHAPFAFFGHSMGASIAFELALSMPEAARAHLRHLFLSARQAPGHPACSTTLHILDDKAFREGLREMNGTPAAALENDELMSLIMPTLRADFTLIETYRPQLKRCVPVDITAFAGTRDTSVPMASVADWQHVTYGEFAFHSVDGGHFFLEKSMPVIAEIIASRIDPAPHAQASEAVRHFHRS